MRLSLPPPVAPTRPSGDEVFLVKMDCPTAKTHIFPDLSVFRLPHGIAQITVNIGVADNLRTGHPVAHG
jgi:hypothetical protein